MGVPISGIPICLYVQLPNLRQIFLQPLIKRRLPKPHLLHKLNRLQTQTEVIKMNTIGINSIKGKAPTDCHGLADGRCNSNILPIIPEKTADSHLMQIRQMHS